MEHLGVLIIRKDLSKESMVGTLGFFGLVGNLLKVAGFALMMALDVGLG